jgi:hypothetical protein
MFSSAPDYVIDVVSTEPYQLEIGDWVIEATVFLSTANRRKNEVVINGTNYQFKSGIVEVHRGRIVNRGTVLKTKSRGKLVIAEGLILVWPNK